MSGLRTTSICRGANGCNRFTLFFRFFHRGYPLLLKNALCEKFFPYIFEFFNIKVLFHKIKSPFHKKSCFINQSSVQIFKIKIPSYKIKISVLSRWENVAFWPQGYVNPKTPISIRGRGYFPKINAPKNFSPYFFRIFQNGFSLHCLRKLIFHHLSRFDFRFFEDGE